MKVGVLFFFFLVVFVGCFVFVFFNEKNLIDFVCSVKIMSVNVKFRLMSYFSCLYPSPCFGIDVIRLG